MPQSTKRTAGLPSLCPIGQLTPCSAPLGSSHLLPSQVDPCLAGTTAPWALPGPTAHGTMWIHSLAGSLNHRHPTPWPRWTPVPHGTAGSPPNGIPATRDPVPQALQGPSSIWTHQIHAPSGSPALGPHQASASQA
jgi:hypothetical protein